MTTIWAKKIRELKNHTLAFTYSYKAEKGIKLKIAASSLYRLFVNGKLTGYGPARAAHGYSRVDEYDMSNYASTNINIVVEVFAANINSYYIVDELPFFAAEIVKDDTIIATATDFKSYLLNDRLTKVQRFSFQRTFVESYRMKECRQSFYLGDTSMFPPVETEVIEANKLIDRYVSYPTLELVQYQSLFEKGTVTQNTQNKKLHDRAITNIGEQLKGYKFDELDECISDEVYEFDYQRNNAIGCATVKDNEYVIHDFGRTLTGFFELNVTVIKPTTIYIVWDEIVTNKISYNEVNPFRNGCCNVIKYVLEKGNFDLLSFEANTERFAKIIVADGEIKIGSFGMALYENPDAKSFQFESADQELGVIVKAAVNTFAQNAVDILTDCPSRERAGWLCDSYFSSRAEALFTGDNKVEKSFLENYIMSPQSEFLPKGMLPMCYPADHNDSVYIPNWTMWFVLELSNYLKRTGDRNLIYKAKSRIYDLIAFFSKYLNEDGLLENLESWVFIEWSMCNDAEYIKGVNYPSNMIYSAMLKVAGEMYDDLSLIEQSERMKKVITQQSYNGEFFEDNRVRGNGELKQTGHLTETCQYYAFYFDVAKKEDFPQLFETMLSSFGPNRDCGKTYSNVYPSNAIVGNYLRLELLLQNGYYEQVLSECKAFFTKMAEMTGTLWEHSSVEASLNHGFASVAANYIVECLKIK